jgi:hypothetical protein
MKLRIIPVLFISCAAIIVSAARADLPKTAQLVPADTFLLVDIGDFNGLIKKLENTPLYRLYKDPAMRPFMENFTGKLIKKLHEDDAVLKTILDANNLPSGKVTVATMLKGNPDDDIEPTVLVISQWGRNIAKMENSLEKSAQKSVEKGAHKSVENYRDVNIVILTTETSSRQVPDVGSYKTDDASLNMKTIPAGLTKNCFCFIDDCLIVSNDVDTVKFAIAHIKGAAGSTLADNADYVAAMADSGPYHDVDLFLNLRQLLMQANAGDTTGQSRMEMANLGFDNLASLGCSIGINSAGDSSISGKAVLKVSGARKGIMKILETRSEPIKPPRFIPASTNSFSIFNLDIKRAYDEFCSIMYGFSPAAAAALQQPLAGSGDQGQTPITMRNDIIEYFGSQIVIAQSINKPFSVSAIPTETLIAVSINNRASLEKSLSLVHRQLMVPKNPEPTRELLGHTIYLLGSMGFPTMGGAAPLDSPAFWQDLAEGGPPMGPRAQAPLVRTAFTITDTHLIIGPEPAVERAIRTLAGAEADSVAPIEWFVRAKSAVPSVVGLACLEDTSASAELMWWMLKEGSQRQRSNIGLGSSATLLAEPDLWRLADFTLLPDYSAVKKYFGSFVMFGVSRPDGFQLEFKYLNPKPSVPVSRD